MDTVTSFINSVIHLFMDALIDFTQMCGVLQMCGVPGLF